MTMRKHRPDTLRALCARLEEDDGVRPQRRPDQARSQTPTRKDRQLCKQVLRALNLAVLAESGSPVLRDVAFIAAEPAPDASRLRITVDASAVLERAGAAEVRAQLARATGFLRSQAAAAISRKRVPELTFVLAAGDTRMETTDEA